MENQAVDAMTLAGSVGALDFSLWALFDRADLIVKSVIMLKRVITKSLCAGWLMLGS